MSENKYLVAVDLDGTLLTDDKRITPRTAEYLKKLSDEGHYIVIASGRPLRACLRYQQQMNISAPIICYNGALTLNPTDSSFPERLVTLEVDVVKQIISELGFDNMDNMMLETMHHIYMLSRDDQLNVFFWNQGLDLTYGNPIHNLEEPSMTLIFKLKERSKEFDEFIVKTVEKHENYKLRFWDNSPYCEVYLTNGTKKDGFAYLAEVLNIPHENTVAIGDAENDIQLLTWSNHAIAMKNAIDLIKNAATIITKDDNNHDGIIEALDSIING